MPKKLKAGLIGVGGAARQHLPGWKENEHAELIAPADAAVPAEWDVEEFASALIRFDNGASVVLEVSSLLHHHVPEGQYEDMQVWLYGDKGGAVWPSNHLLSSDPASQRFQSAMAPPIDTIPANARECRAFAEAVARGMPSPVPAEHALNLMAVLQGIYQSAQTGREVVLDLTST